ncbi:hypothetical protein PENNAL_c0033G05556 [Penicillium nalgiovense]|uniref:Uncharacterized protein n=1 Tax=Penicillium nalgiovense TaxID=60175 RepID=A0A1V6Y7E5_PENNA|nr:hypothetical protein PENNAL_c0033G05556 [Penicillium nalgiovense]
MVSIGLVPKFCKSSIVKPHGIIVLDVEGGGGVKQTLCLWHTNSEHLFLRSCDMVDGSYRPFSDERNDRKPVFEYLLWRRRHHRSADVVLEHQHAGKPHRTNCIGMVAAIHNEHSYFEDSDVSGLPIKESLADIFEQKFILDQVRGSVSVRGSIRGESGGATMLEF